MNTESITYEIQQMKGARSIKSGSGESTSPPSIADTSLTEEEGKSMASMHSESGIHASQIATPPPFSADGQGGKQDGGAAAKASRKTKRQLWDDLTISGMCHSHQPPPFSLHCRRGERC